MSAISPAGNFARAFEAVIGAEGAYSNDPRDPGGETKFGIADTADGKKDGGVDLNADGIPDLKVKDLTLEQAKAIYAEKYWTRAHCSDLTWPLCLFVFDSAVNQGVSVAVRLLQKALGTVQDGVLGNNTLTAIRRADQAELCALFMADRALRYTGTRNFDVYGRGWLKRLFKTTMEV